jgi:hypothetical protein
MFILIGAWARDKVGIDYVKAFFTLAATVPGGSKADFAP